ncbi:uncharacterized protein LOC131851048 [Achroia grisella]|uniref:uncharacterized protein LOC131851048 n=1 Tax=Achroia grisella TaxID=688607 RepID=UPI0027D1F1B2|nr:uncharacterized protein LOC131851048 [Achroia grisella]
MLRKSLILDRIPISLLPSDRQKCGWIANSVIIQCILVFLGSATVLHCIWTPDNATLDFDKLLRIMYLFDPQACDYNLHIARSLSNIQLPNNTFGLQILPIKWKPAIMTVSTRLSAKTRKYIELSLTIHIIWMFAAMILRIATRKSKNIKLLKVVLAMFLYISISVLFFDISMAIVYVAHIQQSLTKGMVLRYSGWSVELQLRNYDDFAGWLPITASICWMRGIVILTLNIYSCKIIYYIRKRMKKREVKRRLVQELNLPIPEPAYQQFNDKHVLHCRSGEHKPFVHKSVINKIFY